MGGVKLYGGIIFITTLLLIHFFRNSEHTEKRSVSFKNLFGKCCECIRSQSWKNFAHVRVVHQTCTKHQLEGHKILCNNIIFHGNQYILLLHHVFTDINKIKITCFDLQAMTASQSVQVPQASKHQRLLRQRLYTLLFF